MSNTDLIARLREAWLDDAEERCLVSDAADALTAQAATIAEQARELEALRAALQGMLNIVSDSRGVAGYHLNGDIEEWDGFDQVSAADAAMQSGKAVQPHDNRKCGRPKCNGNMRPGTYLAQTFSGVPDFPGDTHAVTVSPSGPGRLAECLKCDACGHSVTAGKAVES